MQRGPTLAVLLTAGFVAGACWWAGSPPSAAGQEANAQQRKAKNPAVSKFMRAKLAATEAVLEGIVTEDFGKIEGGALRLQLITTAEEWRASDDQAYLDYSAEFRRIVARLKDEAVKKNLDGAALNHVEMTLSCVRCHKFLRSPPPDGDRKRQ